MLITPETKALSLLFGMQIENRYIVPVYQRNYSWKEAQIEELINDIKLEDTGYYVGNVLVVKTDDNKTEMDIIDGQQRLTTISLILLALYERFLDFKDGQSEEEKSIKYGITSDIKRMLITPKKQNRIQLLDDDDEIYKSLLKVLSNEKQGSYGNRSFFKRYKFIKDTIYKMFSEDESDIFELSDFYNKVITLEVLSITVTNLSDAYSAFSSINSKGMALTPLDLLKVEYLKNISSMSNDRAVLKWNELLDKFKEKGSDDYSTQLVTQFLLNNYDTFESISGSSITKGTIIKKYRDLFKKTNYINDLIDRADTFISIVDPTQISNERIEIKNLLISLSKLDSSQAYPLIFYIFQQEYKDDDKVIILKTLINFFVRRNICTFPKASNIRAKMIDIVRTISKQNKNEINIEETVVIPLRKFSPQDEQFSFSLSKNVYDITPKTVRFILVEIERKNNKVFNKNNPDTLDEIMENNKPRWTLEHILPQGKLDEYWINMIKDENEEYENRYDENVHKIGNLTLTAYNAELGTKSFLDKRDYKDPNTKVFVGLRTNFYINQNIPREDGAFETMTHWTIEDINRRTNLLTKIIVEQFKI